MAGLGRSCWRAGATTVFLALAVLVAMPSQIRSAEDLDALNKLVVQLYDSGKYAEAVAVARRAVSLAQKLHGPEHPRIRMSSKGFVAMRRRRVVRRARQAPDPQASVFLALVRT